MSAKSSGLDFISQRLLPMKIGIGGSDCLEDAEVFYCFLPKTGAQTKLTGDTKGQELEKHERERGLAHLAFNFLGYFHLIANPATTSPQLP